MNPYILPGLNMNEIKFNRTLKAVSDYYSVPESVILKKERYANIARARQVFFYLLREHGRLKFVAIAKLTGKHHTSIIHSHRRIKGFLDIHDEETVNDIDNLLKKLIL